MTSMMISPFSHVSCDPMNLAHLASDPMGMARLASDPMDLAHLASSTTFAWLGAGDEGDEGEDERE